MANVDAHVGRTEPQQARSRAKYDRVLDAADRLFAKMGVEGTQMTILAKEAGIGVSSLYHLFSDRDEVAEALGRRYADELISLQQPVQVHDLAELEPVIATLVDLNYQHHLAYPGFTALTLRAMASDSSQSLRDLRNRQVEGFCHEVEDLVSVSPEDLTTIIANALDLGQQVVARVVASKPEDPQRDLLHLQWMIMYYVCGLLRPDRPVNWPI